MCSVFIVQYSNRASTPGHPPHTLTLPAILYAPPPPQFTRYQQRAGLGLQLLPGVKPLLERLSVSGTALKRSGFHSRSVERRIARLCVSAAARRPRLSPEWNTALPNAARPAGAARRGDVPGDWQP